MGSLGCKPGKWPEAWRKLSGQPPPGWGTSGNLSQPLRQGREGKASISTFNMALLPFSLEKSTAPAQGLCPDTGSFLTLWCHHTCSHQIHKLLVTTQSPSSQPSLPCKYLLTLLALVSLPGSRPSSSLAWTLVMSNDWSPPQSFPLTSTLCQNTVGPHPPACWGLNFDFCLVNVLLCSD